MKKTSLVILGILFAFTPATMAHAISSEIHVTKDGKAVMSTAKVMQIAGNTFFTRLYWGDSFIRFAIRTNTSTRFLRATGEPTTIKEIKEGDLLDVVGSLESQSDTLTLAATEVKNSSVQKEQTTLSGTVISVDLSDARQFLLSNKGLGVVTIKIATTTQFLKGTRTLDLEHLRAGDQITKVSGDYDLSAKIMVAQSVTTYINKELFKPRLYIGKLYEKPVATNASWIKVTVGKTLYSVSINDKTIIMNNKRSSTTLERFVTGDTIRLYGSMREVDEPVIDAEVIRNINL